MSTPSGEPTTDPAPQPQGSGQPSQLDTPAEDAAAQEALARAAQEAGEDFDDDALDPRVKDKIAKLNREARGLRERLKDLEPLAKAHRDRLDAEKTETQRLSEQLAARDKELTELRANELRRDAATAAGLPVGLAKFITATTAEDALDQAKELAEQFRPQDPSPPRRPDLRQGQRGTPPPQERSRDDLIRLMAGRQ